MAPSTESENERSYRTIYELELSLLSASTRSSAETLNTLLADGFYEFGSSGKLWLKSDLLRTLPLEELLIATVEDFKIVLLSANVILATYKLIQAKQRSLRSSIWRADNGRWQMVFHQGTLIHSGG